MIDFATMLEKTTYFSKPISIMLYLYDHSDHQTGHIITSYKKIQGATNTSAPTVAKVMIELQNKGIIRKIQNGVWQFVDEKGKFSDD